MHIQESDTGFDYTLYDRFFREQDGGQLDNPAVSISTARDEIAALHGIRIKPLTVIPPAEFERMRENPLKTAEDSIEQNDNNFDGRINNTPSVGELEAKVKAGETISLTDLAAAVKNERKAERPKPQKKPSIRAQLKADKDAQAKQKAAREKSQDRERE